jgi:murein L,D-transpeptidase YafK
LRKELEKTNSLKPINERLRLELEKIKDDSKKMLKEQKTIQLNTRSNTIIPPSTKTKDQELGVFNNWNNRRIVTSQLNEWVTAWESQNTNLYLSFYSKNFKDPKRSRSKWEAKRRRSLKNAFDVSIEISDIRSTVLDNLITIVFTQRYKAKNIFDLGEKELIWKKEGQNWKIIKETWRPSFLLD